MSKDLWFAAMERRLSELEDAGVDPDAAYDRACDEAHNIVREQLAERADQLRQRQKDEGK